ncbi:signal peptidase I [Spirochaetota bacterium]
MQLNFKKRGEKLAHYIKAKTIKQSRKRFVIIILSILLFSIFLRNYLLFPLKIKTNSMYPSLNKGDFVFFSRISLGIKKPFSDNRKKNMFVRFRGYKRGDIIAFSSLKVKPKGMFIQMLSLPVVICTLGFVNLDPQEFQVRRVLAREGERIIIKNKEIYINDSRYIPSWQVYFSDRRILPETISCRDNVSQTIVPAGEAFLISDNWDYSVDSRFYGTVPVERLHALFLGKMIDAD